VKSDVFGRFALTQGIVLQFDELPARGSTEVALGKLVKERTAASCDAWPRGGNAERRERESDVEKNRMEESLFGEVGSVCKNGLSRAINLRSNNIHV
jgi:hypothetical protein